MEVKCLEIRDKATFIPALAIDMNPGPGYPANDIMSQDELKSYFEAHAARTYLLRRCGYPCDGHPNVILTRLDGSGKATNDPYAWGGRTWPVAHNWIIENWAKLRDGDVVDVEWILGETTKPKKSERFTVPI
jgi:hypothetical protein